MVSNPHALILLTALVGAGGLGCDRDKSGAEGAEAKAKARGRVEAVAAEADPRFEPSEFCERWHPGDEGPRFSFPPLASGSGPAPAPGPVRWVNLWATWCGPCIEEFPRLAKWQARLGEAGHRTELVFVSVDDADADLDGFYASHPEVRGSLQIADPDQLPTWLGELGLSPESVLPVHLFVDGAGQLRCVRMGGVGPEDYAGVENVISAL